MENLIIILVAMVTIVCIGLGIFLKLEMDSNKSITKDLLEAENMFNKLDNIKNKVEYVTIPAFGNDDIDYHDQIRQIGENKYFVFFLEDIKRAASEIIALSGKNESVERAKATLIGVKFVENGIVTSQKLYEALNGKV